MKGVIKLFVCLVGLLTIITAAYAADQAINARTELAAAPAEDDILPIYDTSGTAGKRITVLNLLNALESALTGFEIHADNLPATLTSLAGLTETGGGLPYGTADDTYAWLAAGAAYSLLQMNSGGTAPAWVTSLTGISFDLGNAPASGAGAAVAVDANGVLTTTITNLLPPSAGGADLGSTAAEWDDLYLHDGAIIYGQADQSATLTSSASLWTANNFAVTTQFRLPSSDADPTGTAGYVRHDSTNTSASGGGLLAWHDGTNIRQLVDTGTTYTQITKSEYFPIRYAEDDDSVTAPAAVAEIGSTTQVARSFAEDADNGVVFWWHIPLDFVSGVKFRVYFATDTNAGANETAVFALSGCAMASSGALACSEGTAGEAVLELTTDEDTGELLVSGWSSAITIGGTPTAGKMAKLLLIRDVAGGGTEDDMVGHALVSGIEVKYVGKLNAFSDY